MRSDRQLLEAARPQRTLILVTVVLGAAAGAMAVAQAWFLARILNAVLLHDATLTAVKRPLLFLLGAIVLRSALAGGKEIFAHRVAARVKTSLRRALFSHLLEVGPLAAADESAGELTHTLTEGVEAIEAYFREYLPQIAQAAFVPLLVAAFVLARDPLSGIILLVTAPLVPLFLVLIGRLADAVNRRQWRALSRLSAFFLDLMQGLTTLKILGQAAEQREAVARVTAQLRRRTMAVLRVAMLSALTLELLTTLSTAVVAVEIGLRLLHFRLAFQDAFFILLLAPEFYLPFRLLGTRFHAGMAGTAAAARIFEILETPVPLKPGGTLDVPSGSSPLIEIHDVSYAYPGRDGALHGIDLRIAPGERVALVGPSGGGKSTLVRLLLRFMDPDHGAIRVNGTPLDEFSVKSWRRRTAWVPQRPFLFHDTVLANIRLGRPDAPREDVIEAARQASAHEFIETLPQAYDTVVGEHGARLSGGQAQRIVLARAFLKNADFLILDEASANLDPDAEARLTEAVTRLLRGRSALIVAHRLPTVLSADRILVLADGRIAQEGTHRELVARAGPYRALVGAYGGAAG